MKFLLSSQHRWLLTHPTGLIATGFGSGLSPIAPGTVGSVSGLIVYLALQYMSWAQYLLFCLMAFVIGVYICQVVIKQLHIQDPQVIVFDEWVGLWISFGVSQWCLIIFAAQSVEHLSMSVIWFYFANFAGFRLADIIKPWPICWLDKHVKGGFGVMLDDACAGLLSGLFVGLMFLYL